MDPLLTRLNFSLLLSQIATVTVWSLARCRKEGSKSQNNTCLGPKEHKRESAAMPSVRCGEELNL